MSDRWATIIMVDSTFSGEQSLPSEKAFAYKMKLHAMQLGGAHGFNLSKSDTG